MALTLTTASTTEQTAVWLSERLPDSCAAATAAAAREAGLNGAALLALTEDQMGSMLRLTKFGHKRKLTIMLKEARDAAASTTAGAPSTSSATPVLGEAENGTLDQAACERQLQDECYSLGLVKWVGSRLHTLLTAAANDTWASGPVKRSRLAMLDSLRNECELPGVSIVVVGNTGAGKSTLLNALLDETAVLPTNGMRACTASLIEMRHEVAADTDPLYRGE